MSAVLLIEGRPALGTRLERLLFDQGFEALHLSASEVTLSALSEAVRVAQTAGIVVLYSGSALDVETKHHMTADAEERFSDIAESKDLHGPEEELARQALAFAQALRLSAAEKNQDRVN